MCTSERHSGGSGLVYFFPSLFGPFFLRILPWATHLHVAFSTRLVIGSDDGSVIFILFFFRHVAHLVAVLNHNASQPIRKKIEKKLDAFLAPPHTMQKVNPLARLG